MDDVTIDLSGTQVKRRGLNLRQYTPIHNNSCTKTMELDYDETRRTIRDEIVRIQEEALSSDDYYSMSSHDKLPKWLRGDIKMRSIGILTTIIFLIISGFIAHRYAMDSDTDILVFIFLLTGSFIFISIFILLFYSYFVPIRLSCRTFKDTPHEIPNEEIDRLFEDSLQITLRDCMRKIVYNRVMESRILTRCTVSPLRVALGKVDVDCILKIEPIDEEQ